MNKLFQAWILNAQLKTTIIYIGIQCLNIDER